MTLSKVNLKAVITKSSVMAFLCDCTARQLTGTKKGRTKRGKNSNNDEKDDCNEVG